jgi:hypothetical protein
MRVPQRRLLASAYVYGDPVASILILHAAVMSSISCELSNPPRRRVTGRSARDKAARRFKGTQNLGETTVGLTFHALFGQPAASAGTSKARGIFNVGSDDSLTVLFRAHATSAYLAAAEKRSDRPR